MTLHPAGMTQGPHLYLLMHGARCVVPQLVKRGRAANSGRLSPVARESRNRSAKGALRQEKARDEARQGRVAVTIEIWTL